MSDLRVTKWCADPTCAMRDIKVKVDLNVTDCLSCGKTLHDHADLFREMLDGGFPWGAK